MEDCVKTFFSCVRNDLLKCTPLFNAIKNSDTMDDIELERVKKELENLVDSGKPMIEILRVVDSKIPSVNQFFYGLRHLIQDSRINYPEIAENTSKYIENLISEVNLSDITFHDGDDIFYYYLGEIRIALLSGLSASLPVKTSLLLVDFSGFPQIQSLHFNVCIALKSGKSRILGDDKLSERFRDFSNKLNESSGDELKLVDSLLKQGGFSVGGDYSGLVKLSKLATKQYKVR